MISQPGAPSAANRLAPFDQSAPNGGYSNRYVEVYLRLCKEVLEGRVAGQNSAGRNFTRAAGKARRSKVRHRDEIIISGR